MGSVGLFDSQTSPLLIEGPGERGSCIYCPCTTHLTACGGYVEPGTPEIAPENAVLCGDCVKVLKSGCLVCGCRWDQYCDLCES